MAKDREEFTDIRLNTAVADLTGRRHGHVVIVIGKGHYRVRWDGGEDQVVTRDDILIRYTTESRGFVPARG